MKKIILLNCVFQEYMKSKIPLIREMENFIMENAFPSKWDYNLFNISSFLNFKVFINFKYTFISYFYDDNKKDKWDRPCLSANIACIPHGNEYIRYFIDILEFLTNYKEDIYLAEDSLIYNFEKNTIYLPTLGQIDIDNITMLYESFNNERRTIIYSDVELLYEFLNKLFMVMPISFLNQLRIETKKSKRTSENGTIFISDNIDDKEIVVKHDPWTFFSRKKTNNILELNKVNMNFKPGNKHSLMVWTLLSILKKRSDNLNFDQLDIGSFYNLIEGIISGRCKIKKIKQFKEECRIK